MSKYEKWGGFQGVAKRFKEQTGERVKSVTGKHIVSGAASGVSGGKDRVLTDEEVKEGKQYTGERSEKRIEFAKVALDRAQFLLAHFPAEEGWLLLVNDMGKRKDRNGRVSPEMTFTKEAFVESLYGGSSVERLVLRDPNTENARHSGMKFYRTDAPEVLHLITEELQRSPNTDFYKSALTGEDQHKFLRVNEERLAFLEKAQEAQNYNVGDLSYLRRAIYKENEKTE